MPTPKFTIRRSETPRGGDHWLLLYQDEKRTLFPADALPPEVRRVVEPPADRGGCAVAFAGQAGKAKVKAHTARLDAEYYDTNTQARRAVANALSTVRKDKGKRLVVPLKGGPLDLAEAVCEGALAGGYTFDRYLTTKPEQPDVVLVTETADSQALQGRIDRRRTICEGVNAARDVLNGPPNVIHPPSLASRYQREGRAAGLTVTVWGEKRLKEEKCGGIVTVGQGAKAGPRLVIGEYKPNRSRGHLCLVGKGVTFDSGGYGLKPAASQIGMKYDMGGAAMMFAAACTIARLKLALRVTVLNPLAENDVSGEAYHTTSIITTRSGRTVEVSHTDAEGRLLLADALTIAGERQPDWIIDSATLTGACVMALGEDIAGVYGTDAKLTKQLIEAGRSEGERFWELPLHMPYGEQLKTTIADCKNTGARYGGSISACVFLKAWVDDAIPWIHCDIAGPAGKEEPLDHLQAGAKGFGVKAIVELARRLSGAA